MSEQIREQVSAFLDGELPNSETELLLKRLTRDAELRESFGRYALIGESLRGDGGGRLSQGFAARVNRAIDGEPVTLGAPGAAARRPIWWRPFAGAAVAGGVMVVAVLALQQRSAVVPVARTLPAAAAAGVSVQPKEPLSYTVPTAVATAPTAMPAARLTNYVFAHSKYSSVMGQNDVLNDLLTQEDAEDTAAAIRAMDAGAKDTRVSP